MPELLVQYGLAVVFAWAFAVQAGVPAPAVPMLLGAGALSGSGQMNLALAIGAAMIATLGADVLWYALGRSLGAPVLGTLCRFSQDPDSSVRGAKERFVAHRLRYLVLAKFLPGVNPLAAGLAGVVAVRPGSFLLYAAIGAFLWAGAWMILGYLFADVIGLVATRAGRLGTPLVLAVAAALIAYLVFKYARRRHFLRHLQKARITPVELKRRLDAGDHLVIVDLRTALDIETAPYRIPGAYWIAPETLRNPHQLIPRGSEVVFYCAEPREGTSARMALLLTSHNRFKDLHPLSGGLEGWREAGFAVEPVAERPQASALGGTGDGELDRAQEGTMMKTPTIVLLALLSTVAAGCAARQAEMAAASAPTANVAGVWTGSGGTGGVFVPVTLTLTQNDTAVKGTISVGGRPDYSGDVTGSVQGELLRLALPTTTLAELRVTQDTIAGEPFGGLPLNLRRVR